MQTYRIDHIHLICPNIESAKQWYIDVLGGKQTFESESPILNRPIKFASNSANASRQGG